jgi:hypothetical protein
MGYGDYLAVKAFQEATGIKPATGDRRHKLDELQNLAFDLIKICELDKCGIRDGDSYWHGCSNVIDGTISDMMMVWHVGTDRTKWGEAVAETKAATP